MYQYKEHTSLSLPDREDTLLASSYQSFSFCVNMDHRTHVYMVNICVDYNNVPNTLDTLADSSLFYQGQYHVPPGAPLVDSLTALRLHSRPEICLWSNKQA